MAADAEPADLLRHRAWSSVLAGAVIVAALRALLPWAINAWERPDEDPGARLFYASSIDTQYLPQIASVARGNFGESEVYELAGHRVKSFPFDSTVPYSLFFAALSIPGLAIAEAVISVLAFSLAARLLRECGLPPPWQVFGGLLYVVNQYHARWLRLDAVDLAAGDLLPWSSLRGPRPAMTEVYALATILLLRRLFAGDVKHGRVVTWSGVGLLLAALVQGDLYAAVPLGLAAGLIGLGVGAVPVPVGTRVVGLAALATAFAVGMIPFILQRLSEHADVPVRFGVFPWRSLVPPFLGPREWVQLVATVALVGAVVRLLPEDRAVCRRSLVFLGALVILSFFSLPLTAALTRRLVQLHHFRERFLWFCSLAYLLLIVEGVRWAVLRAWTGRPAVAAGGLVGLAAALVLGVAAARGHVKARRDGPPRPQTVESPTYRVDLDGLFRELQRPVYPEQVVMATTDLVVYAWWSGPMGRHHFLPDPYITTVSDEEIERRLVLFAKLIGMSPARFAEYVKKTEPLYFLLGTLKYQFSAYYTAAPLEAYPALPPKEAVEAHRYDMPLVVLPSEDLRRLRTKFAACQPTDEQLPRLDVIVLTRDKDFAGLAPPAERFEETYANGTFRVFRRQGRVDEIRPRSRD